MRPDGPRDSSCCPNMEGRLLHKQVPHCDTHRALPRRQNTIQILCGIGRSLVAFLGRSVCRKENAVSGLSAPAASPTLEVSVRHGLSPRLRSFRTRKAVMPGTLMLPDYGLTIATREWSSDELLIGRLSPAKTSSRSLYIGDLVRLHATFPEQPVEIRNHDDK